MELKNISLIKYKNTLINIGLIILALVIGKNIYSSQVKKIDVLKLNKDTELKNNALINDISRVEKRINAYKQFLQKRDTSAMINNITQIAASSQIKITSIRPEGERGDVAYNKLFVRINITAKSYHQLGDFISKLESAPEFYMIVDSASIRPIMPAPEKGEADKLSVELLVSSLMFKG